jgi:NAD(P)H-hydrate epimerase
MENAGRGCVDVLQRLGIPGPVVVLCGKGNNAGDGFVIARHLQLRGHECRVLLLAPPAEFRGDAAANHAILAKCDVPMIDLSSLRNQPLIDKLNEHAASATWLIDALLGTGAVGEPRPPFDTAIDWMNNRKLAAHQPAAREQPTRILAVDLPSGLDCDTGEPANHTVRADHTCTFAAMKLGFANLSAKSFLGDVLVCDIGISTQLLNKPKDCR